MQLTCGLIMLPNGIPTANFVQPGAGAEGSGEGGRLKPATFMMKVDVSSGIISCVDLLV